MRILRLAFIFHYAPVRRLIAPVFILIVVWMAWQLSAGSAPWWMGAVRWLGQYELFHVVAHFTIFGGVALLLGTGKGIETRAWGYALVGGLLLEIAQISAGGIPLSRHHLREVSFDLSVDLTGALVGLILVRMKTSLQRGHDTDGESKQFPHSADRRRRGCSSKPARWIGA
jgi:hypothetical protein